MRSAPGDGQASLPPVPPAPGRMVARLYQVASQARYNTAQVTNRMNNSVCLPYVRKRRYERRFSPIVATWPCNDRLIAVTATHPCNDRFTTQTITK